MPVDLIPHLNGLSAERDADVLLDQPNRILCQESLSEGDGSALVELLESLGYQHHEPGGIWGLGRLTNTSFAAHRS